MIDLTYAKAPVMKLEHALNFLKGNERADYIDLKISEDYAGDVKTATWTSVAIPAWPEGTGWSFVTSGDIDLSAYAGKKVTLAWHYIGTTECAPTYEVKNVSVKGTCDDYYADVCLFKEIPQSEAVMTRASGNAVSHGLYRYNGTAWELFESDEAEFTTVSVDYYSVLGTDKIEKPKDVLPPYLAVNYPYAQKGDRVGLAYIDKNKDYVIEEYSFLNGVWTATPEAQAKTSPFNFDEGGYVLGKSTYYEATLTDGDDGGFKPQDVLLTEGLTFVWKSDNSYGRKGQAYISSKGALESDSWLISPEIDLTEAETPILIFEEAVNKISASVTEQMKICVSTGYENDATACDWDELEFEERPAGNSWDFMSNQTDLTAYKGQKIRLAFHYTSTKASAGTWEVKNISIAEPAQ